MTTLAPYTDRWCDELAEEIRQEWWDQLDAEEALRLKQLSIRRAEEAEDILWELQDQLMGY